MVRVMSRFLASHPTHPPPPKRTLLSGWPSISRSASDEGDAAMACVCEEAREGEGWFLRGHVTRRLPRANPRPADRHDMSIAQRASERGQGPVRSHRPRADQRIEIQTARPPRLSPLPTHHQPLTSCSCLMVSERSDCIAGPSLPCGGSGKERGKSVGHRARIFRAYGRGLSPCPRPRLSTLPARVLSFDSPSRRRAWWRRPGWGGGEEAREAR